MPVFKSRTIFEVARGVKAFLNLEAGLTRGEVPGPAKAPSAPKGAAGPPNPQAKELQQARRRLKEREQEVERLKAKLASTASGIGSENIVWIFCSNRSGSTWLSSMMGDIEGYEVWNEPLVGKLFGDLYYQGAETHKDRQTYILGTPYKASWLNAIQSFVLNEATSHYPEAADGGYVVIKEPNGSIGAPLLSEAMPESRVIYLARDPRDAVASGLDAGRQGSWQYATAANRGWKREALADTQPDTWVKRRAQNHVRHAGKAKQAYDEHQGPKVMVRYEELRADTLGTMKRLYSTLGIPVNENQLARAVEKHSWENIPDEKKGEGKFYRKATPGSWKEDLTPEQIKIVENVTAPLLNELYPS
jgi:Sulfotransferase domain